MLQPRKTTHRRLDFSRSPVGNKMMGSKGTKLTLPVKTKSLVTHLMTQKMTKRQVLVWAIGLLGVGTYSLDSGHTQSHRQSKKIVEACLRQIVIHLG